MCYYQMSNIYSYRTSCQELEKNPPSWSYGLVWVLKVTVFGLGSVFFCVPVNNWNQESHD